MMKIYEIILLLMSEFGDRLSGRTRIQKLCYFYSTFTKRELGFRPHYYGPYSPAVENALDELEGIGLIDKKIEVLGANPDGFDVKRYDYEITKYGRQVVETIHDSQEKRDLKDFITQLKEIEIPPTMDLSIAAKAYYILEREGTPLTADEIHKKALAFGWDIDSQAIDRAANFLWGFSQLHRNRVSSNN